MAPTDDPADIISESTREIAEDNDLVGALNDERSKRVELEIELERLLDDIDRFQDRLDQNEEEIEDLLVENKKLNFMLDSLEFKLKDNQEAQTKLKTAEERMKELEKIVQDQSQKLEEQEFLIRSLENDLDHRVAKAGNQREQRLSEGRKSYHMSAEAKKDATIVQLQTQLAELSAEKGEFVEKAELDEANEKISGLQSEKEGYLCEISALKVSVKNLQEKMKQTADAESKISSRRLSASARSHEWKLRAEAAEQKLQSMRALKIDENDAMNEDSSPQALLLQSVISRKKEEKKAGMWTLGGMFSSQKSTSSSDQDINALFKGNKRSVDDPNDLAAIKEINQRLKEANMALQRNIAQLEKSHKKEDTFNQKLIVKLQADNEKLLRKLDENGIRTSTKLSSAYLTK